MLLIIGRFQVHQDRLAEFQAYAREVVEAERRVEGNLGFDILQDVSQPGHFVILEQWRDQVALDHHTQTEEFAHNEAKMSSFFASEADWSEYEV
jgi:quinol monooxygenase YgiN